MATLPLKLNGEFRPDLDSKLCGRLTNPQPARFGVGATRLAFEERDPLVSKFRQMLQRQPSSLVIVQDDGSYPLQMSGWEYRDAAGYSQGSGLRRRGPSTCADIRRSDPGVRGDSPQNRSSHPAAGGLRFRS